MPSENTGWVWWLAPLIPACEKQRLTELHEFKDRVVYRVSFRSPGTIE